MGGNLEVAGRAAQTKEMWFSLMRERKEGRKDEKIDVRMLSN